MSESIVLLSGRLDDLETLDRLRPLDEAVVRAWLAEQPELAREEPSTDELVWDLDGILGEIVLDRTEDGLLRAVEANLSMGAEPAYIRDRAHCLTKLTGLAARLDATLWADGALVL